MMKTFFTAVLMALFLVSCATTKSEVPANIMYSGFLPDYSLLKDEKDAEGNPVKRYFSPEVNPKNYQKVMVDRVVYYPEVNPSAAVDGVTLEAIRRHLEQTLRAKLAAKEILATEAGPGVIRMRIAIASVTTEAAALKAYQYIPIAYLVHKAGEAVNGESMATMVFLEVEATDSVTGELLGEAIKQGDGATINEGTPVVASDVVPLINRWAQLAADFIASRITAKQ